MNVRWKQVLLQLAGLFSFSPADRQFGFNTCPAR